MIDSHAHLDFKAFQTDREAVLERAWAAGLSHIVTIGAGRGADGAADAVALAAGDERIHATVGVHPHDADLGVSWQGDPAKPVPGAVRDRWETARGEVLARMASLALHPRVVAIGEVGLDYHYDRSPRELQRELFRAFVRLASEVNLPVVIHSREADEDTLRILEEENVGSLGGVIHCYTGSPRLAVAAARFGLHLGLTGVLTYPTAAELRRRASEVPLEQLLVETDCPYLTPVPHRGKRNEPARVVHVVEELARLRGLSPDEAGRVTAENTRRLFGIGTDQLPAWHSR